ncbi:hypothetical protein P692DRAFT_20822494 [Suillus brevipes Sb2]|nr:hypothetical protein P692DRAFT_20822494 [Suillus brevipes Sb2]
MIVKGQIEELGQWGVIIYDIALMDPDKVVENLSKNQVLHQYTEMQEQLVSILRDMADTMESKEGEHAKVLKVLETSYPWDHISVCKSMKVVMGIYRKYLECGTMVWHYLGSKEEGPTLKEVKMIVDVSERDDEESEDEQETQDVINMVISIIDSMSLPDNDDCLVFVPFMNNIGKIKAYKGSLEAHNTNYEEVLKLYHNDVVKALQDGFTLQSYHSKDKKK